MKTLIKTLTVGTFCVAFAQSASADFVTLTGGDPSGGLSLNANNVIYADSAGTVPSGVMLQGVSFSKISNTEGPANVSFNAGFYGGNGDTASNAGFTDASNPTPEDTDLLSVINSGFAYNGGSPIIVNITGLTANTYYDVDTLFSLDNAAGTRSGFIDYNNESYVLANENAQVNSGGNGDANTGTYAFDVASQTKIYAEEDKVKSNSSGDIDVDIIGHSDGPIFNNVIVSKVTPEPSTWGLVLMGMGGLLLGLRRKTVRNS